MPLRIFVILFLLYAGRCCAQSGEVVVLGPNKEVVLTVTIPQNLDICSDDEPLIVKSESPVRVSITGAASYVNGSIHPLFRGNAEITVENDKGRLVQSFIIGSIPPVIFSITPSAANYCNGERITYAASINKYVNEADYRWKVNGVEMKQGYTTFESTTLKTNDVITFTVTNPGSCGDLTTSQSITVPTIKPSVTPLVSIGVIANPICAGSTATFTANTNITSPGMSYHWQVNGQDAGTNSPQLTISTLKEGDQVTCIAGNLASCVLPVASAPITMHVNALPEVSFTGNKTIDFGKGITLAPDVGADVVAYSWSPADGLSCTTIATPVANPQKTTTYTLTATNANGCSAQANVTVNVKLSVPNAFTPNGDGTNDKWEIPVLALYPDCVVNVFNRYGNTVYQTKGYSVPWDGTNAGKQVPAGTYYYKISTTNNTGLFAGSVTIIR